MSAVVVLHELVDGDCPHEVGPEGPSVQGSPFVVASDLHVTLTECVPLLNPGAFFLTEHDEFRVQVPYVRVTVVMVEYFEALPSEYIVVGINEQDDIIRPAHFLGPEENIAGNSHILESMDNLDFILVPHLTLLNVLVCQLGSGVGREIINVDNVVVGIVDALETFEVFFEECAIGSRVHVVPGRYYAHRQLLLDSLCRNREIVVKQVILGLDDLGLVWVYLHLDGQLVNCVILVNGTPV